MLFAPGNDAEATTRALHHAAADAAILDLEDTVPTAEKARTRQFVRDAVGVPHAAKAYVRVNGVDTPWFFGDLEGIVGSGVDGVVLPKVGGALEVYLADRFLTHLERERGLTAGSIDLLPLIETARGMVHLPEIAASRISRMRRLTFGAVDLSLDVGFTATAEENELLFARTRMAIYSRSGELDPPIDTVYLDLRNTAGFEDGCRRARALGFQGRLCVHPDQVRVANRVFAPAPEELAWARDVVTAFREAEARGRAAVEVRGQFVDYPVVRRAERLLREAGQL